MVTAPELNGATERFLIERSEPAYLTARQVRARASLLVDRHAARLGMDGYAALQLRRAIDAIPAEGDA